MNVNIFRFVWFVMLLVIADTSVLAQSLKDFTELDAKFGPMHLKEIEQLATRGSADAQAVLGVYYSNGIRVPLNKVLAEHWYLKAARQGHEDAQYNLGQMYRNGDLGKPDYKAALYWYEEAAKSRVVFAPSNIAGMHYEGRGVPRSVVNATKWMIVAKHLGDTRASSNLAELRGMLSSTEYARAEQLAREWIRTYNQ